MFRIILLIVFTFMVQAGRFSVPKYVERSKRFFTKHLKNIRNCGSISSCSSLINNIISVGSNTYITRFVPPSILFFLLGVKKCNASPLNKQVVAINGPFFQGWLVRSIDHVQQSSFILIIGSFSSAGNAEYDQHYIFVGINSPDRGSEHYELFPTEDDVIISSTAFDKNKPVPPLRSSNWISSISTTNITWSAKNIGYFECGDMNCVADLNLSPSCRLKFNCTDRLPWSKSNFKAGPEGWLGYTPFLPCHYYVHSVGSLCNYMIYRNGSSTVIGQGYSHIEGNYGSFFPEVN